MHIESYSKDWGLNCHFVEPFVDPWDRLFGSRTNGWWTQLSPISAAAHVVIIDTPCSSRSGGAQRGSLSLFIVVLPHQGADPVVSITRLGRATGRGDEVGRGF